MKNFSADDRTDGFISEGSHRDRPPFGCHEFNFSGLPVGVEMDDGAMISLLQTVFRHVAR